MLRKSYRYVILCALLLAPLGPGQIAAEATLNVLREGELFGAVPKEGLPIGGGGGYPAYSEEHADYVVRDVESLLTALQQAHPGEVVFLPRNVDIDVTALVITEELAIEIPEGVTLASDRGTDQSSGAIIRSSAIHTPTMLVAAGPDVRVTGLRLQGPDPERRLGHHERAFTERDNDDISLQRGHAYYYLLPNSRGILSEYSRLEVDNCEISGFSHAAIALYSGTGHRIHHSYIHHNQRHGLGYGILHLSAQSTIEYNRFAWNRHSIAGTGDPDSGYVARHNVEEGPSLSHNFDMHGSREGSNTVAGSVIEITNNTFLSDDRSIAIRGAPGEYARIERNWFMRHDSVVGSVLDTPKAPTSVIIGKNAFTQDALVRDFRTSD